MKIKQLGLIIISVLLISFLLSKNKEKSYKNLSSKPNEEENTKIKDDKIKYYRNILVTIGSNQIVINPTSVEINITEFGGEKLNPKGLILDSTNYPNLFEPEEEFARIHTKEISGGDKLDTKLIYVARQIPNHGDIADSYYVIVDPEIGKVVDTGYNLLFGNVHFENSCTSCALPVLLFREYDRQQQKFVLSNNKHQKEFRDLLKQYEERGNKEICRINGKISLINEVIKTGKDNEKCGDINDPDDKPAKSFITVGEYKQIINKIKEIINGKNIEMVSRGFYGEGLAPL